MLSGSHHFNGTASGAFASEAGQVSGKSGCRLDVIICGNHPRGCLTGRLPVHSLLVYPQKSYIVHLALLYGLYINLEMSSAMKFFLVSLQFRDVLKLI